MARSTQQTEFEEFWAAYPRKVGKLAAEKAFGAARKRASQADIVGGVVRYLQSKPEYADWCHPKTWLNQGRWLDEPDQPVVKPDMRGHYPPCRTNTECLAKVFAEGRARR